MLVGGRQLVRQVGKERSSFTREELLEGITNT